MKKLGIFGLMAGALLTGASVAPASAGALMAVSQAGQVLSVSSDTDVIPVAHMEAGV